MPSSVVLIHGIGQDRQAWKFLDGVSTAAARVAYEIPGHGSTPRQPGMSWTSLADDLLRKYSGLLDLVSVGAPGEIVLQALVRSPDRIRSALIVAGGRLGSGELSEAVKDERQRRAAAATNEGMASFVDEAISRWFGSDQTATPAVAYARETLLAMDPLGWADAQFADLNTRPVSAHDLATVDRPVTIVGVKMDRSVSAISGTAATSSQHSLESARRLQAQLRLCRFVEVEGAGMLHLANAERFAEILEAHLGWVGTLDRPESR